MKKITLLSCIIFMLFFFTGCIKTNDLIPSIPNVPGDPTEPTPTEVGTPVGEAVTKIIGKNGGSIASGDGNAELIFPAGALEANTEISIQAMTNTALNGIGNSYRFLPEGIKFLQPVTLKFHYGAIDAASAPSNLMGIAYQDSSGGWWRVNNFTNDAAGKIISAPITHFSIWTAFDMLLIYPRAASVGVNKSLGLEVQVIAGDDELTDLGTSAEAPIIKGTKTKPITWAVNSVNNGNSSFGTIAGTSFYAADYHAPSKAPASSQNPVLISATLDVDMKYKGEKIGKASLLSNIKVLDVEVYLLEVKILDTVVNYDDAKMIVWDSLSMKVTIKDDYVTISEITNFPSKATPTQLILSHEAWYFVPDGVGPINVLSAKGEVAKYDIADLAAGRLLAISFTQSVTLDPKLRYLSLDNGYTDFSGGDPNPGSLMAWGFQILPDGELGISAPPYVGIMDDMLEVTLTLQK